jgi:hypothetical protein
VLLCIRTLDQLVSCKIYGVAASDVEAKEMDGFSAVYEEVVFFLHRLGVSRRPRLSKPGDVVVSNSDSPGVQYRLNRSADVAIQALLRPFSSLIILLD